MRYFRVRIQNAAGAFTSALTFTSVPGGTNPYLAAAPAGAGQEIDILSGKVTYGGYAIQIIDPVGIRAVTTQLADALGQYDLLGRVADVSTSPDGTTWTPRLSGFVESIRYPAANLAEIEIGDAQRIDRRRDIFATTSAAFDRATSIIGGPVRGGWGSNPAFDNGPWRMKVGAAGGTGVRLDFVRGYVPVGYPTAPVQGPAYVLRQASIDAVGAFLVNRLAEPYLRETPIQWEYPGLTVYAATPAGVVVSPAPTLVAVTSNDEPPHLVHNGSIFLDWTATLPSVGAEYDLYVTPVEISKANPLHVSAHPIDMHAALWTEAGIPYDAASAAAVKAIVGPDVLYVARFEGKLKLADFQEQELQGPHRYGWRQGPTGDRVFYSTRREDGVPAATIVIGDLLGSAENQPVLFEIDEKGIVRSVTVTQTKFTPWIQVQGEQRPADAVVEHTETVTVEHADVIDGDDLAFTLHGYIGTTFSVSGPVAPDDESRDAFALALAASILPRFGYGCPTGELLVTEAVTAQPGQEVVLTLAHQINGTVRGGSRIVQLTKRTERFESGGVLLRFLDAGATSQVATAPTFTLAANPDNGKAFADLAITNAAALITANSVVRFEWGTGGSAPATGALLAILDPATVTALTTPQVNAGTKVWVRARAEHKTQDRRPSAWTAWASVDLTDLAVPTALARTGNVLTWTVGEASYPVEVLWRPTAESVDTRVAILPAGSTQFDLTPYVPGSLAITATVRHRDEPPYSGVSSSATLAYTTPAAATVTAPTAPSAWVGPQWSGYVDGSFGIAVTATALPSSTEMEIAVETGVGAGTYGSYALAATVESVTDGRTRLTQFAPQDRLLRKMRARHRVGTAVSGYTAEVGPVDPWGTFVAAKNFRPQGAFVTAAGADDGYTAQGNTVGELTGHVRGDQELRGGSLYVEAVEDVAVGTVATPDEYEVSVHIPPASMQPQTTTMPYLLVQGEMTLHSTAPISTALTCVAAVMLAQGVVITKMEYRGRRDAGAGTSGVSLFRLDNSGGSTSLATVTLAGTGYHQANTTLSETVSDNAYSVVVTLVNSGGAGSTVGAVWVKIYYQKALPLRQSV